MRKPKIRELCEAIKALIKGPYTTKFPKAAHVPFARFRGKNEFHEKDCIGCGACSQVCPARAIDLVDELSSDKKTARRKLTVNWDLCIFCGQCQASCPTEKGIILSNEFDISTTEKGQGLNQGIEKELVLCECCQEIIAPRDQILWAARKLGPLCFSNASLMLFYLQDMSLAEREAAKTDQNNVLRSDRIKVMCPKCRREAVIKS
jgi:hydrogenase-4 component H